MTTTHDVTAAGIANALDLMSAATKALTEAEGIEASPTAGSEARAAAERIRAATDRVLVAAQVHATIAQAAATRDVALLLRTMAPTQPHPGPDVLEAADLLADALQGVAPSDAERDAMRLVLDYVRRTA